MYNKIVFVNKKNSNTRHPSLYIKMADKQKPTKLMLAKSQRKPGNSI